MTVGSINPYTRVIATNGVTLLVTSQNVKSMLFSQSNQVINKAVVAEYEITRLQPGLELILTLETLK